ncbi:MAG: FAD-dependent thymidylate synthase, partial [Gemmatimonadetes bacterium]|nr:FAD-dependent thymidylate synthase [Gemmatimonadota bacterium]
IDLHNLLHFLTLRVDARAQWEIQQFARVIAGIVKRVAPLSYEAWVDYDLAARPITRAEREVLSRLLTVDDAGLHGRAGSVPAPDLQAAGLSRREVEELAEKLASPTVPDFELDLTSMRTADDVARTMYQAVPSAFE